MNVDWPPHIRYLGLDVSLTSDAIVFHTSGVSIFEILN